MYLLRKRKHALHPFAHLNTLDACMITLEQDRLCFVIAKNRLENAHQRILERMMQIVLDVNGQRVIQHV